MTALIRDVLTVARLGSGKLAIAPTPFSELVERAKLDLQAAISEAQAQITCDALPVLAVDGAQFAQVIQNLLSNAIKFRRPGSCRIHIAARQVAEECVISVQDDGIGIEPKHT